MPRRNPGERLADIVEACDAIAEYVRGFDVDAFRKDRRTVDAILRNVTVIGEAARGVPIEIRRLRLSIPWVDIADMRNVVVHEYFGVDLEILWRPPHPQCFSASVPRCFGASVVQCFRVTASPPPLKL